MRHRRTFVQRNRNGWGIGDTPSWRQAVDACCFSRALLIALFFAAFLAGVSDLPSVLPVLLLAFTTCHSLCGQSDPARRSAGLERRARTHGKTTLQLAIWRSTVSACAWDIVEPRSTITGWGKFWKHTRPGTRMADAHCFSRALLVALFLTALNVRPSNSWYEWPTDHKQNVCHLAFQINNRLYFLAFLIDPSKSTKPTAWSCKKNRRLMGSGLSQIRHN